MNEDSTDFAALSYYQKRIRMGERMTFVLRAYAYLGVILTLFGGGFVIYSKLKISLTAEEQIALAFCFMGALIAVFSYGMLSYRRAVYERDIAQLAEHQAVGRFIDAWARFEQASFIAAFGANQENKHASLREALKRLRQEGQLTPSDQIVADELLQTRNSLVHGAKRLSASELERLTEQLVTLITKLA